MACEIYKWEARSLQLCFSFSQANSHIHTKLIVEMVLESPKFKFPAMSILPRREGTSSEPVGFINWEILSIFQNTKWIYSYSKKLKQSNQTSKTIFNASWLQRDCQHNHLLCKCSLFKITLTCMQSTPSSYDNIKVSRAN